MYIKLIAVGSLAAIFMTACQSAPDREVVKEDAIPVTVLSLKRDSIQQQLYATGQFTTDDETQLSFKTGGIVQRVYVKEGDAVKKGQILATLNLTEVNAFTEQTKLAYQKAQRDFERATNLYKDSVATLEQMQNAKTALDVAKQQYGNAGFNQTYAEIKASQSGYVLKRFANEGQIVGPGTPILMINGAAQSKWILQAGVSDYQWAVIEKGDAALVTTDAIPGKQLQGVITKKSEGIDPMTGTFLVQITLAEAPQGKIASGLFGKASITPRQQVTAWAIPYDALLDGDAGSGYVFVTNDDSTASKVKVQIGKIEKGKIIIQAGLEQAKALIVSGNAYLNDGSKIRIVQTSNQ